MDTDFVEQLASGAHAARNTNRWQGWKESEEMGSHGGRHEAVWSRCNLQGESSRLNGRGQTLAPAARSGRQEASSTMFACVGQPSGSRHPRQGGPTWL